MKCFQSCHVVDRTIYETGNNESFIEELVVFIDCKRFHDNHRISYQINKYIFVTTISS